MEYHELPDYNESPSQPGLLRRSVNYTSKKVYQALYKDEHFLTKQLTTAFANVYKESYKFFTYNPEILAIADQHDAASFKKFLATRSLNYVPVFGHAKQILERMRQKQFISKRSLPIKSLKGTSHLLGSTFSAASMYYGAKSGVNLFDRDFSDPSYVYAFLFFCAAKFGYYSLGEELHNEYASNRREAQKRFHQRKSAGLPRDPSFLTRSKGLGKESMQERQKKSLNGKK